jgi:hypothetical protein
MSQAGFSMQGIAGKGVRVNNAPFHKSFDPKDFCYCAVTLMILSPPPTALAAFQGNFLPMSRTPTAKDSVTTDKKREANHRNALRSTGPKTGEGVQACKNIALRHGLRAVQTVVPGEDPGEWEIHLGAVVADLRPEGPVELALAEGVALKLWRLGRVVRYEADLIANAQDPDDLAHAHEKAYRRFESGRPARTDVPTREDVAKAKRAVDKAEGKVTELNAALRTLEGLAGMRDEDAVEDWSVYEPLKEALGLADYQTDDLFEDEPFLARYIRVMLRKRGGGGPGRGVGGRSVAGHDASGGPGQSRHGPEGPSGPPPPLRGGPGPSPPGARAPGPGRPGPDPAI